MRKTAILAPGGENADVSDCCHFSSLVSPIAMRKHTTMIADGTSGEQDGVHSNRTI